MAAVTMLCVAVGGCATSADTVYVYDGADKISAMVNDIAVWKNASSAQSSERLAFLRSSSGPVNCLAGERGRVATRKQVVGNAVEVRVHGRCTGFVNAHFVHDKDYGHEKE
ncbi:hypothetical protein [Mesorhizobium sp. ES1-1]|uniref:hypothetical protein n=1 Tax=Mesorhizobium sp. ES1-1 TaxID=2876629 RepID=UPI001CCA56CA|nr:hypothetical protein [Mesorhizobium sp. ES1-1]MBZ9675363.1 hypothetical protein [Mesorhizobium sp. ES1-1]